MTLAEMQEARGRLVTQAREALNEIKTNTDESRTAELEQRHDTIMADFDKLEAGIAREQRVAQAEARIAEAAERQREQRRPGSSGEQRGSDEGEPLSYRSAFQEYLRSQGQLGAMRPEARAVLEAGFSPLSQEERAQMSQEKRAQTTSNSAGGYTVPTEVFNVITKSMAMWGPMYDPGVTSELVTAGGGAITMPTVNDTGNTAAASGGEGVTLTDDGGADVTFGSKTLNAYAFDTEWLRVSKELADDSIFNMETLLGELLGERLGRTANSQLTVGTGSSAPNGIVTASTAGKTAASATAITADEIIDLLHSVDPAYRMSPKAAFMMHDVVLAAVRKLKDGQGNYLWQMGNVQQGVPASLLGYRVYVNQAMDSTINASSKAVLFGDFGKYYVRKVGAPLIGALQDKDFWPGFGIAGYIRFDGELSDTAAVKHLVTAAS